MLSCSLSARHKSGAGAVEDLRLSLRARTPDFASLRSSPDSLHDNDGGDGDEADQGPGRRARRPPGHGGRLLPGVEPDGEVEVTKQSFATTRRGLGELAAFLSDAAVDDRGDGGDRRLLEAAVLRPRRAVRRAVAVQRPARKERARAERAICPTRSGWPTWRRTGWCGPPSSRRLRSASCAS